MRFITIENITIAAAAAAAGFLGMTATPTLAATGDADVERTGQLEYMLTVPLASIHLTGSTIPGSSREYNARNYGVGISVRRSSSNNSSLHPQATGTLDYGGQLGTFKNSYYRQSVYAAGDIGVHVNDTLRAGFLVGVVSGYRGNNFKGQSVGPLVAPQIEMRITERYKVILTYVPTRGAPGGSSALAGSVGYQF